MAKKIDEKEVETKLELTDIPGIGPIAEEKLKAAGYGDVFAIAVATVGELVEKAEVTENVAKKAIEFAREHSNMGFKDADEFEKMRANVFRINTGSKELNKLLGGGVESGVITELAGGFASGKTQLAHQLAVNCWKDHKGLTVYVDTESTFRASRIEEMAPDVEDILKKVKIGKAYNSDHQMLLCEKVEKMITEEKLPIKMLIVDSLTAHFRGEFIGRGTLSERQGKLNRHLRFISKLADIHNIVVLVTNQVTTDLGVFYGNPDKPIGGHIVGHTSCFRLFLRKGAKGSRVAKLIDGPVPEGEAAYIITEKGIKDI